MKGRQREERDTHTHTIRPEVIGLDKQTDRQADTDRHINSQTGRQTDTQTERQADRQTGRQIIVISRSSQISCKMQNIEVKNIDHGSKRPLRAYLPINNTCHAHCSSNIFCIKHFRYY